jgi:hypothetical protein
MPVSNKGNDELRKQIDSMNIKLDKLVYTIQNLSEKINKAPVAGVNPAISIPTEMEDKVVVKKKEKKTTKKN